MGKIPSPGSSLESPSRCLYLPHPFSVLTFRNTAIHGLQNVAGDTEANESFPLTERGEAVLASVRCGFSSACKGSSGSRGCGLVWIQAAPPCAESMGWTLLQLPRPGWRASAGSGRLG